MKKILKQYEDYLKRKEKEESTTKMYVHVMKQFQLWLESKQKRLEHLTENDVYQFREHLIKKGNKIATINKLISILRSFLVWATKNNYVQMNIPENLRLYEERKEPSVTWLTAEEETLLLQTLSKEKNPFKKARNEALIHVLLYSGLRIEEISNLHTDAVTTKTIQIFHDGILSREIPLIKHVVEKLETWIDIRNLTGKPVYLNSPYLFVTERSGKMQSRSIQFVIEVYSEKLGFPITSKILRNTYCRRLVEDGYSVEQVKQYAGHKSITTSYKYFS
ncbi:tyrosine-type recombinase/integrase [Robertmurraya massiliosenegalensis]|uniref:tyrosine-type recombinase/integrase n=1 Tax=Robertmurraya TaxID=2837507 RepID=UPI0039A4C38B